jgi:hypothetical protein
MYSALTFEMLTPRGMMKVAFDVMQLSAETFKFLAPGRDDRVVWKELKNKLQAFDLFENVDTALGVSADGSVPLRKLVEKACALDAYRAVWVTEGVGHYHTEMCWERAGAPRRLLRGADALPARSLAALHAGMGLSLASRLLKTVRPGSGGPEIRGVLRRFVELCEDNSGRGYVGAAYEALGLVARNLYPHLLPVIDRQLSELDEKLSAYFWHGVGRAIYFAPTNFLPFNNSPWRAVEMSQREPAHETGRLNALAGLAWAMVLVNIREPEILEAVLRGHGGELSRSDAFSNGVSSAVMIWRDSTEGDPYLEALWRHQPEPHEPTLAELWAELVSRPCRNGLRRFYPVMKEHDCLGEAFRYQSLPDLVERLERDRGDNRRRPAWGRGEESGSLRGTRVQFAGP